VFPPQRAAAAAQWRELHKELQNLYSSGVIELTRTNNMICGHVQCIEKHIHIKYWTQSPKQREHLENMSRVGRIIIK
jgi:hypothetical protein